MSLQSITKVNIDFCNKKYISINAKQYDRKSRYLLFTCYNSGELFPVYPGKHSAYVRYKKADEYNVFNFCEITSDNKVLVELTEQMLAVEGICYADLVIVNKGMAKVDSKTGEITVIDESGILSTMSFCVDVCMPVVDNVNIESSYEYDGLNDALEKANADYSNVIRMAKSYTNGDAGGIRENENTDNALYYYKKCLANANSSSTNADNAETYMNNAKTYMNNANTYMTNAKSSETKAATSATNAKTSETNAKTSETKAAASATKAATSETNAETHMNNAATSATNAKSSSDKAATSATNASKSESNAKTYMNNANTYMGNAKSSEDKALASELNAKSSETKAATSATNAKTSETNAKSSEDKAKASETNANTYMNNASTYMNNAETHMNNAATSATNASKSESNARTYMNNASVSEVNALNSAKLSQSYAVGGTETRENEDNDNAKYYCEQVKNVLDGLNSGFIPMGTVSFSELANVSKATGYVYNINENFVTDNTFKEGAGISYTIGTNVYFTGDGYWDCFGGSASVTASIDEVKSYLGI